MTANSLVGPPNINELNGYNGTIIVTLTIDEAVNTGALILFCTRSPSDGGAGFAKWHRKTGIKVQDWRALLRVAAKLQQAFTFARHKDL